MEISSPLTGRRGVSLPFSDFCLPLNPARPEPELFQTALDYARHRRWRYLEFRGNGPVLPGASPSNEFFGHWLDLEKGPDALFAGFESAMRRGIRKAQQAGLRVEFANTLDAMRGFYELHCQTRQRHGLPPQPRRFFDNIARFMLEPGFGFVVTVRLDARPVAAAVFLHHHEEVIYKFGASDYRNQALRPNNLLMWEAISRYSANGFKRLHFGRTSTANDGLRRFKLSFGAVEDRIAYHRFDVAASRFVAAADRAEGWFNRVFRLMPSALARLSGELLYPHLS
jgi:hypothetical protein